MKKDVISISRDAAERIKDYLLSIDYSRALRVLKREDSTIHVDIDGFSFEIEKGSEKCRITSIDDRKLNVLYGKKNLKSVEGFEVPQRFFEKLENSLKEPKGEIPDSWEVENRLKMILQKQRYSQYDFYYLEKALAEIDYSKANLVLKTYDSEFEMGVEIQHFHVVFGDDVLVFEVSRGKTPKICIESINGENITDRVENNVKIRPLPILSELERIYEERFKGSDKDIKSVIERLRKDYAKN